MAIRPCPELKDLPAPPPGARGWPWTEETPRVAAGAGDAPPFTIVTPSLDQARFLEATIRSVLLQGYPALEYVVLDGGSRDGSVEIVRKYEPWLSHWASEEDRGQSHAINKGLGLATGELAGWVNSDDRLLPGALQAAARAAAARPDAVAFAGRCRSVTPEGKLVYLQTPRGLTRDELADWGRAGQISQPACFFRREAAQAAGGLDEALQYTMDVAFWLELAARGPIVASGETWAEETLHEAAKTSAQRGRQLAELHRVQILHGYEDLAFRRLSEELQEYEALRRGTPAERLKQQLSVALQPILSRIRK